VVLTYASCRRQHLGGSVVIDDELTFSGLPLEHVAGRNVLIQVHGVKNRIGQIERAYTEVARRSSASFDAYVGFIWPGGATPLAYPIVSIVEWRQAVGPLYELIGRVYDAGAASIDIDAHSLGVPIALEAAKRAKPWCDNLSGLWLKAGAMPRDLGAYRNLASRVPIHVFYSRKDPIVRWLYRFWWPFRGALGALGEKTPGGNVGTNHDCTAETALGHTAYRHSSIVVQAQTNHTNRRWTVLR
jgi:hypothetical protein